MNDRRWFRFTLRTFFVLLTLLGMWFAYVAHKDRQPRFAAAAIKEIGGTVAWTDQGSEWLRR